MKTNTILSAFILTIIAALVVACDGDDEPTPDDNLIEIPDTYEFTRDGATTVSFSGQTDRLNMLSEIKTYVKNGDEGEEVSASKLNDMFANTNGPFENAELNSSTKQLENKTFIADVQYFKDLFTSLETASQDYVANASEAAQGQSGMIERGTSGDFVLLNDKGWEYTQFIEKGLMGAVFLHQILNSYLTEDKIGPAVENVELSKGKNYTTKEHHFDEAFGYWGVPVDFPDELAAEDKRFWASYSYGRESLTGSVTALKDAFLKGRTAIVNNDETALDEAVIVINEELELLSAATAIHYLNDAIEDVNAGDLGNLFHHASEAYMFARAIKYQADKKLTDDQLNTILNTDLGTNGDFWTISVDGLNQAKSTIATVYAIGDIADQL
ncbi:MAG: DUF4856 domain-containing protein [Cyclobacteriaceae bacterium]